MLHLNGMLKVWTCLELELRIVDWDQYLLICKVKIREWISQTDFHYNYAECHLCVAKKPTILCIVAPLTLPFFVEDGGKDWLGVILMEVCGNCKFANIWLFWKYHFQHISTHHQRRKKKSFIASVSSEIRFSSWITNSQFSSSEIVNLCQNYNAFYVNPTMPASQGWLILYLRKTTLLKLLPFICLESGSPDDLAKTDIFEK